MVFLIGTLAFSSHELDGICCADIAIETEKGDVISLQSKEIDRLVKNVYPGILSMQLGMINADSLETEMEKHPVIEKVEAYKVLAKDTGDYKGILALRIKHRNPVLRVVPGSGMAYYLDRDGQKLPVSIHYSANVLTVTGAIKEEFAKEQLLPFVKYMEGDDFWQAQIEQAHISEKGELLLSPLVGNHLVEFGNLEDYEEKLRNLKAFYKQVLADKSWNKYGRISLKFENQIIAKRK